MLPGPSRPHPGEIQDDGKHRYLIPQAEQREILIHPVRKLTLPLSLHLDMYQDQFRLPLHSVNLSHDIRLTKASLGKVRKELLIQEGDACKVETVSYCGEEESEELSEEQLEKLLE
jgi:hypothetical protein